MFINLLIPFSETSAEGNCRNTILLCAITNALHNFTEAALPVSSSLSGYDQICIFNQLVKIDQVQNSFDTGFHFRVQEDLESCTESACSARARRIIGIDAELSDNDIAVVAHSVFQTVKDLRSAAFLLAEGVGRTVFAAERIGHVAHNGEVSIFYFFIEPAHVDIVNFFKLAAFSLKNVAILVKEADTQRAGKTHTTVICCGTADCDRNIGIARVHSCFYQLACSVGRCVERISEFFGNHRQSGRLCHFQNDFRIAESSVVSVYLLHQRSAYLLKDFLAFSCQDHRICGAFAAVRNRDADRPAGTEHFVCRFGQILNGLLAGNGSLK